ncbi:hypothetical protein [Tabrizicola sp.]|uniref:hypothetical protein n=1 Tax=Tabrizicola sp. TaxID=2005166 RepID=UPI003F3F6CD0
MTSESKILTVSYGTFSCTLEGFDNPFDTMKAIAEYFRDLAAQDRHFGAEPPPPDAAMLHRLAEREVSRMVAKGQTEDTALASPDAEPAAPKIQLNTSARRPSRANVDGATPADEDGAAPEPSLQEVIPDGVAAKLARIRKTVNPAAATLATPVTPFAADETPELPVAELPVVEELVAEAAVVEELLSEVPAAEDIAELAPDLSVDGLADSFADLAPEIEPEAEAAVEAVSEGSSEDVAASLAALIEDELPEAAVADAQPMDIWSDEYMAEATEAQAPVAETAEDALAVALAEEAPMAADDFDDIPLAELADESPDEAAAASEDVALLAALDGVDETELAEMPALDDRLPEDEPVELTLAEAEAIDPLPEAVEDEIAAEAMPFAAEPVEDPALASGKGNGRAKRLSSRVVRIHPEEDEPAPAPTSRRSKGATRVITSGSESDEIARLMQQAEEVMAEDENRRRQEALSHLKAAVVATEADRADIDYVAPKAETHLDPYRDDLAEAIQPEPPKAPPAPPEVKPARRKSVSIRPATEPRPGTIRPGMISPPPLVLVSEQRIDRVKSTPLPAAAPAMSPAVPGIGPAHQEGQPMVALRTGRLSGAIGAGAGVGGSAASARNLVLEKPSYGTAAETEEDEELAEDSRDIDESGFAAFAEIVGAKSIVEMLEAAAAYATCAENRTQFTRPQLMRRMMASAGGKPVSREDGLRSFGTLLRTGRIEKINRGHYSLAETSPYLAEARRLN